MEPMFVVLFEDLELLLLEISVLERVV